MPRRLSNRPFLFPSLIPPFTSSASNFQTDTSSMHLICLCSVLALLGLEIARAVDYFPPPTLSVNESSNECVPLSPSHLPRD